MARSIAVLVLEDHGESLALLHAVLEPAGIRVISARSTEEAKRLIVLQSMRPDVILSDLVLPGEDGLAFIRWLRAEGPPEIRRVPAIAMTAFYERYGTREVREAGFDMYVQKPLDPDQIPFTIGLLVAKKASGERPG
ncbi:MAG TPA: response regulator [Methylomirabilota bacterium]|jgi:CheY-like chemotaxis protein|nr:response regulator [Methylomirabilota bacterium]